MRPSLSMSDRATSESPLRRASVAAPSPSATSASSWTTCDSISAMSRWKALRSSSGTDGRLAGRALLDGRLDGLQLAEGGAVDLPPQQHEVAENHQRQEAGGKGGKRAAVVARAVLVAAGVAAGGGRDD